MPARSRNPRTSAARAALGFLAAASVSACGLEAVILNAGRSPHLQEVTVFKGKVALDAPTVKLLKPDGTTADLTESRVKDGTYEIKTAAAAFDNVIVLATQGDAVLSAFVPHADRQQIVEIDLDAKSQALTLVVQAKTSAEGMTLRTASPLTMRKFVDAVNPLLDEGLGVKVREMVQRLLDAADKGTTPGTPMFQEPKLSKVYATMNSAINPAWFSTVSVEYTGDGKADAKTTSFDNELAGVAFYGPKFVVCYDPVLIRTVFAVNFNEGQKNGACGSINRFGWVTDAPGKRMYFVGGLHEESPIQDPAIDKEMGNPGSWAPNTIPMYDDGTHGDEVANDNIWTISFNLPRGARVAYKYTWGNAGDLWTGTEEWPGNQRLLEITDMNGDNFVYRADAFGDEASNKDKVNGNPLTMSSGGTVTFSTDMNKDGVPDAREQHIPPNGCIGEPGTEWHTPTGIGPATIDCVE
jgi:hypothetical protein